MAAGPQLIVVISALQTVNLMLGPRVICIQVMLVGRPDEGCQTLLMRAKDQSRTGQGVYVEMRAFYETCQVLTRW
jgi:hypothetical protein